MIALEEHLLPKDVGAAIGVDPASLPGKSDALDDLGLGAAAVHGRGRYRRPGPWPATNPPLPCALMVFGTDRMLFSVDHPFSDNSQAAAFLRDPALSPADRQKIAHSNAKRLLRL